MDPSKTSKIGIWDWIFRIGGLLALLGYVFQMLFSLVKGVSLVRSSPKTMLIIGLIAFLISFFFGIYLLILAWSKADPKTISPYLRKRIVIPFLMLFILNVAYISYLAGHQKDIKIQKKTRIVLLLPLNESLKSAYEDGVRQLIGFAEFLKEKPECTREFEFMLYDHSMDIKNAERIIQQELIDGTKYFLCTMSNVSLPLSRSFKGLVDLYYPGDDKLPKLICAVTSAPTVNIVEGLVYRFYIRSQEEATQLANIAAQNKINTVSFIAVDDDYGRGAVREFKNKWKGKAFQEGIYVGKTLSADEIQTLVEQKIAPIQPAQREAIFICHYGNGIDNIVTALSRSRVNVKILATSTISIYDWQKPIINILNAIDWYTCTPDYTSFKAGQDDVIKNFTTYALYRLTQAISNEDSKNSFDKRWREANFPDNLEISWDGADAIIPMKAVYKTEVNLLINNR